MASDTVQTPLPRLSLTAAHPPDPQQLQCPRCDSTNTKFCYYNNYNLSQPRHFCKSCRRYWTRGGTLRNVPVGGNTRKITKRPRTSTASSTATSGASSRNDSPLGLKSETESFGVDVNLNEVANESNTALGPVISTGGFGFGIGSSWDFGASWGMEGESAPGSGATWQVEGEGFGWPDLAISSLGWGSK